MSDDPICSICQQPRSAHATLNHLFSEDGVLRPRPTKRPPPPGGPAAQVVQRLLIVLKEKGVLTDADINDVVLGFDAGRPDREADSSGGSGG